MECVTWWMWECVVERNEMLVECVKDWSLTRNMSWHGCRCEATVVWWRSTSRVVNTRLASSSAISRWFRTLTLPVYYSRTTWVSQYQEGKTSLDLNVARDDEGWDASGIRFPQKRLLNGCSSSNSSSLLHRLMIVEQRNEWPDVLDSLMLIFFQCHYSKRKRWIEFLLHEVRLFVDLLSAAFYCVADIHVGRKSRWVWKPCWAPVSWVLLSSTAFMHRVLLH